MRTRRKKIMAEMNVVPYIDVMLVLLVIFMVTAPMLQTGIDVKLPDVDASPLESSKQHEPLMLSIDTEGNYFASDDSPIDLSELQNYVESELIGDKANRPVYIRADESVPNGFVVKAMAAIQQAGAKTIGQIANIAPTESQ